MLYYYALCSVNSTSIKVTHQSAAEELCGHVIDVTFLSATTDSPNQSLYKYLR